MFRKAPYILLLFLLFTVNDLRSQDLTGTWEGDLGSSEFLQVNIVQVDDMLCGYTWDYLWDNKGDFCKAYFIGRYDTMRRKWVFTGTSFFANSGNHVLMRLVLSHYVVDGEKVLSGKEISPSSGMSGIALLFGQNVYLRRVSKTPAFMLDNMKECYRIKKRKTDIAKNRQPDTIKKQVVPVKPKPVNNTKKPGTPIKQKPADTIRKIVIPVKPIDSSRKIKTPVVTPAVKDSARIITQMNRRKNTEMSHLIVHEKNIRLEVFDNGIIDSDTVSVFYNGKLILGHKLLSAKAIVIPILLDERTTLHEITLFAENLGSIPPNTALVVVHAGDKRYELFASASLTENAVIRFEYKPK